MKNLILNLFGRHIFDGLVFVALVAAVVLPLYWFASFSIVLALYWAIISLISVAVCVFVIYLLIDIRDLLISIRDKK